jgi:hypothetical protein
MILLTILALPVRGVIAVSVIKGWGVWLVEILSGVGLQSDAVATLVVRIIWGTGA